MFERFKTAYPPAAWWAGGRDHRDIEEDCLPVSQAFAHWLRREGKDAQVVKGTDADYPWDPMLDLHYWVVADGVAYDWTVLQFETLDGPGADYAAACPVPLIWSADEPHPIARFRKEEYL